MTHRVGSALAIVSVLFFPLVSKAQVAQPGAWPGPGGPQSAQTDAQPAYPTAYAQPASAPAYTPAMYAAPAHASASMPAAGAYAYTGYPGYGSAYSAPSYAQGNQVAAGTWEAPRAEVPAPLVKTKDNLHYVEMGIGGFVPTDQGNAPKLGLEASVWALHGGWVPNSGLYLTLDASTGFDIGCMAKSENDGCKGHLRIHWFGTGPFFNTGTPMIASNVPRSWDLMALTGAEVRLWKGMTAKATINWFLPSPWGLYAHEKQLADATLSGTTAAATTTTTTSATSTVTELAEARNPIDGVGSILGHALKHPQLNLMAMWEF